MATRYDADCFADEVVIDFPSVGPLVARVRESFVPRDECERSRTFSTEVCLSSDEAHRGAVVPVAVLLRGTCDRCGGRGETWAEPCADCAGTGDHLVPHRLHVTVPPRVIDGSRLHIRVRSRLEDTVHVELRVAIMGEI